MDFKDWWKDHEGLRVEPLTVRDKHSRILLEMRVVEDWRTETVQGCFEWHGLPGAIRSDHGAHERMHLDIRRELQSGRIGRDQAAFDLWRNEFNHVRPHEALAMKRRRRLI